MSAPVDIDALLTRCARELWDTEHVAPLTAAIHGARALRAIIDGRKGEPTPAEIGAHFAQNGRWLVGYRAGCRVLNDLAELDAFVARWKPEHWWALDCFGCPCAWPVVP